LITAQQRQAIFDLFNTDEAFRARVLENANTAVKEQFGFELPFEMRVVMEESRYRIEPASGSADDLTDEQLEMVAGGKGEAAPGGQQTHMDPRSLISTAGGGVVACGGGNFRR